MARIFICLITFLLHLSTTAQIENKSEVVLKEATRMANAFMKGDYEHFTSFIHPAFIMSIGGKSKMITELVQVNNYLKSKNAKISKIQLEPSVKFRQAGIEVQAIISQTTNIETNTELIRLFSILIGISSDNGKTWLFFDTSGKDIQTLQKVLPTLDPYLELPPVRPVVHIKR